MIDWFIQCPFPHVIHHTIPCHVIPCHVLCVSSLHFLSSSQHVCVSMCVVSHPSYMSWYIMSWYGMVWYGMVLFHPMSYLVMSCHVMSCVYFHDFIQSHAMSWNSWFYSMVLFNPLSCHEIHDFIPWFYSIPCPYNALPCHVFIHSIPCHHPYVIPCHVMSCWSIHTVSISTCLVMSICHLRVCLCSPLLVSVLRCITLLLASVHPCIS